MSGSNTCSGINFQYAGGISFLVDALQQPEWHILQFEGKVDVEDVVVFDEIGEEILRVQIKQMESPHQWAPADFQEVLQKFSRCHDTEKIMYQFMYAGSEGRVLINEIKPVLEKMKWSGSDSLAPSDRKTLAKYFSQEVIAFLCKVYQRLQFICWGSEESLEKHNLLQIRKLFTQKSLPGFGKDYERQIYYMLFHFVAHKNGPGRKNEYLRMVKREEIVELLSEENLSLENDDFQNGVKRSSPFPPLARPPCPLIGRIDVLDDLKRRLLAEKMGCCIALNGLPGVGKTAIAIELAHEPLIRKHFCDGILWAGPGLHPDVLTILGEWAVIVGIPRTEVAALTSIEERARAVRTAIGMRRMLLVVDDVWQIETALALQVGGPYCTHLITTRLPGIAQQFALSSGAVEIQELDESASLLLLEQLSPKVVHEEPDEARELIQSVGGLPLALILLGKYLLRHSYQPRRLHTALERLRSAEDRLKLSQPQKPLERHPSLPLDIPLSLQAIIQITADELDEYARHTFFALSVFPPKPNTFSEEAALAVTLTSVEALDTLYDYGLLEADASGRYTLHQTISDYGRMNCEDEDGYYRRMATFFVHMIEKHEIEKEYEVEYEGLDVEITNILSAVRVASEKCLVDVLVTVVNSSYRFLETRGLYYLAETYLEQAERMARLLNDAFEQEFALYHLGRIANRLGRYEKATACFYNALALAYQRMDMLQVVNILGNLSEAYMELQDYRQAERFAQESLALSSKCGLDSLNVAAYAMLGTIYARQEDHEQAKTYFQEALKRAQQLDNYTELSPILSNLGATLSHIEGYAHGEAYLQEALALAQKTNNYEHIAAAQLRIIDTALRYSRQGQAEDYLEQVLRLADKVRDRRLIHATLVYIGRVVLNCKSDTRSREYLHKGITLARAFEAANLASLLLINLAAVVSGSGDYVQAQTNLQEALELVYKTEQHDLVFEILINLGKTAIHLNNSREAIGYFERGLAQASKDANKQQMIMALTMLSETVAAYQKDYKEAEKYMTRGLTLAREQNDRERVLSLLEGLAALANYWKDYAGAREYLQQALEPARNQGDTEKISDFLIGLYEIADREDDYKTAEAYLEEALPLERERGDLAKCRALLVKLAELASHQQNDVKAEVYLEEALVLVNKQDDKEAVFALLLDLFGLAKYQKDYVKADVHLQKALTMAREIGNREAICQALNLLSSFYFDQQLFDLSRSTALESLALAREENDQYFVAVSLHNLGRAAEKQGDFIKARSLGQESLTILETVEGFPVDFIRQWLATLPEN